MTTKTTDALQALLAKTYSCYLLTHNYHWNVEGERFASLHALFMTQYTEMFTAIDEIAERIRALEEYALPGGYAAIGKEVDATPLPLDKKSSDAMTKAMLQNLLASHAQVLEEAQQVKKAAEKAGDDATMDLAIGRLQIHDKTVWMLKSLLK